MLKEGRQSEVQTGASREVEEGGVWMEKGGGSHIDLLRRARIGGRIRKDDGRWQEGQGGGYAAFVGRDISKASRVLMSQLPASSWCAQYGLLNT